MVVEKEVVVEVTAENAEEIARSEFKAEKAEREGKEPPKAESKEKPGTPAKETLEGKPAEKPEEEGKPEATAKTDQELLDAKDEDLDETEKSKKDTLVKDLAKQTEEQEKVNKRLLETADEELKEDELAKKKELLAEKGKEQQEQQKSEKELGKIVKEYAKENEISEEQAKTELESIGKIEEKYGKDSKKLAKANLYLQRLYSKAQDDLKSVQQKASSPNLTIDSVIEAIEAGNFTSDGKTKLSTQQVIDAYREKNAKLTENIEDDEVVLQMAAKEIKEQYEKNHEVSVSKLDKQARTKSSDLLSKLSAEDKKFEADIKPILEKTPASQIMQEDFTLGDLVLWAKGKNYDKAVQEARDDAFKRGRASVKIKTGPIGQGGPGGKATGVKALSDAQKDEAQEMFPSSPPDEAYKLYAEVEEDRAKRKAKNKGKE